MTEGASHFNNKNTENLAEGAKGGAIAFILKISNTVLGFINQIILARMLGAGGIGEVILAITVVRIASQIAKFGMEETMMKFIPLYIDQKDDSKLKGTISFAIKFCLLISFVFMLFVLAISKFISITIFHSAGLLKLMPIVVLAIPAWVIRDVISGILRGYKDALRALIPEALISPFFRILVFLILILNDVSSLYAIIAFVTGEILSVVVAISFLQNKVQRLRPFKKQCEHKKVLDVAYSIIFTGMSILLYTQSDIWILGMFTSTENVGIYGIASKIALLVYFPMMTFASILYPLISSIYASGNRDQLRKMMSECTRWILSMAIPIILILVFEGKLILEYFYGSDFSAGYSVLVVLVLGQMIKAFAGLISVLLMMTGGHRVYMKVTVIGGILNIVLNVILIPLYGIIGAAISTAFCLIAVDITCIFIIHKRLSIITFARGLRFDVVFLTLVGSIYLLFHHNNFHLGEHLLLIAALTVYMWKSIRNHDIPWSLLIRKNQEG